MVENVMGSALVELVGIGTLLPHGGDTAPDPYSQDNYHIPLGDICQDSVHLEEKKSKLYGLQ